MKKRIINCKLCLDLEQWTFAFFTIKWAKNEKKKNFDGKILTKGCSRLLCFATKVAMVNIENIKIKFIKKKYLKFSENLKKKIKLNLTVLRKKLKI